MHFSLQKQQCILQKQQCILQQCNPSYHPQVIPSLERRFDGRSTGALDRLAHCAGAGGAGPDEEGLVGHVLGVLYDAGPEGVYLVDVPVGPGPPFAFLSVCLSV
jgi:hypothetical protein